MAMADISEFFTSKGVGSQDAIYLVKDHHPIYSQNSDTAMIPASLTKLATVYLAINRWGLDHRFKTEFYRQGDMLLIKGYGDPFLTSEELPKLQQELNKHDLHWVKRIGVDDSHLALELVPGRSMAADPYNAPLSATAINFNTAKLTNNNGKYYSAEAQTRLTNTAITVAKQLKHPKAGKTERINLVNRKFSQINFAELLAIQLNLSTQPIIIDQKLDKTANLLYQHKSEKTLKDILRGTLEFSNNFMANQLFLQFDETPPLDFASATAIVNKTLAENLGWSGHKLGDGAGLFRENRLSSQQIDQLLAQLENHKNLFEQYKSPITNVKLRAKSGTLDGVRTLAGYIDFPDASYRFVFMFNRSVPYGYREQLMRQLVKAIDQGKIRD